MGRVVADEEEMMDRAMNIFILGMSSGILITAESGPADVSPAGAILLQGLVPVALR